ncbi:MAG: BamA/TamA family outer membrane protein [Odoribacter sp.]
MKKDLLYKVLLIFYLSVILTACSPTRYVGKDEYLLNRVEVKVEDKKMNVTELNKIVRQRPNTRILGTSRFHLGLYNLSGRNEKKRLNQWLRSIGESPVIYSPFLTDRSVTQLQLYLNNKGYYNASVTDSVWFKKKKAFVRYQIHQGRVTQVDKCIFRSDSGSIANGLSPTSPLMQLVLADTLHTHLRLGMPMDVEILENERERITQMLRKNGYYNFSKNFIQYYADTSYSVKPYRSNLQVSIISNPTDSMVYRRYTIDRIQVNLDYDPLVMANGADSVYQHQNYGVYDVMYRGKMKIKPNVILETVQFKPGELYNIQKVADSYSRLQALNLFKFVNILFKEHRDSLGNLRLNCEIQLTPLKRQSYNVFVEGTNNSGNIGVGGNFVYNHRNLFHGGENLSLSVWGALKKEKLKENDIFSTTEVGTEFRLVTPQFWMPVFRLDEFRRHFAPKTSISLSYSQENTQFYRRRVASAKFGYLWRKADNCWHYNFDLIDLNYVLMPFVDKAFIDELKNEYVKSAYTDHMILSANFSAIYTNQLMNTNRNFSYFRGNVETSGNVLLAVDKLMGAHKSAENGEQFYKILDVRYAQFVKADGEYRFNHYVNKASTFVYRFFLGCGYPYGNMKALPFEEAYYCGGANGLRAWQSRTLGPGAYSSEDKYPNNVGDFKMEVNVEYRFKLIWLLEGALFVDAGNIWNINKYENRPGARFRKDFYEQIAVGTGAGLRLDVNFFLLRFDLGVKLYDPSRAEDHRFVLFNSNGGFKKSVFNIAIGYPF